MSGALYFRASGSILSVDSGFEALFGFDLSDTVGKQVHEMIVPESQRGVFKALLRRSIEVGSPMISDVFSAVELQDRAGDTFSVVATVTEHGCSDEHMYIAHIEKAKFDSCTITFDTCGSVISCNHPELFEYSGLKVLELRVTDLVQDLVPEGDSETTYNYLLSERRREDISSRHFFARKRHGTTFPIKVLIDTLSIGNLTIFSATFFKLSSNVHGVVRVSTEDIISDCNDHMSLIFGYTRNELIGMPLGDLFPEPEQPTSRKRKSGDSWDWRYKKSSLQMKTKSDLVLPVQCVIMSLQEENLDCLIQFSISSEDKYIGSYVIGSGISEGSFGVVKEAFNLKTKEKAAVKILNKDTEDAAKTHREISILKQLDHPNIVKLWETVELKDKMYMFMDHIVGQDLRMILVSKKLDEPLVKHLFRQIASAIHYCHELGIFHRDIKPSNVLVDRFDHVKIIDFGLSNRSKQNELQSTFCGSPAFAAPEIVNGSRYAGANADVWSLGVLLHTMLTSELPFQSIGEMLMMTYVPPQGISTDCGDLLLQLLEKDPLHRPTMKQVVLHPWLQCNEEAL